MPEDICIRVSSAPLVTPSDISPSDPRLRVIGVLNPTYITLDGNPCLVVRVDERPLSTVGGPAISPNGTRPIPVAYLDLQHPDRLRICEVEVPSSFDPDREAMLPRAISSPGPWGSSPLLLSFVSHLRLARIVDNQVLVDASPAIFSTDQFSQYGCEDPRATLLEETPLVAYTAIGRFGATAWLTSISDAGLIGRRTIVLGPDHKHTSLFPERVHGEYLLVTRPLTRSTISCEGIWLLHSPDMLNWGSTSPLLHPRPGFWDHVRVGPGPSPLKVPAGWLLFYYGVDRDHSYHLGAALLDHSDPSRVLARTSRPVLSPSLPWERNGRRADTVFPCGACPLPGGKTIRLYYGAADECIGAADLNISQLETILEKTS